MATSYSGDDRQAALKLYLVNHPEYSNEEYAFWKFGRSLAGTPWGVDRDAAIIAAGTALGVTVDATSPWLREQQWWAGWRAKPPVALA